MKKVTVMMAAVLWGCSLISATAASLEQLEKESVDTGNPEVTKAVQQEIQLLDAVRALEGQAQVTNSIAQRQQIMNRFVECRKEIVALQAKQRELSKIVKGPTGVQVNDQSSGPELAGVRGRLMTLQREERQLALAMSDSTAPRAATPSTQTAQQQRARLVSTSNAAPFEDGAYMVIDISKGTSATTYPVTHFDSSAKLPGGANDVLYKTEKLLLRRIPSGTFMMGSAVGAPYHGHDEVQHSVTLTKNFYIGVFEMTQRQWELVMGKRPSRFKNPTFYQTRPVECVSYYEIREDSQINMASDPDWPQSNQVHPHSFVGRLRAKTGLTTLDLPTEAQWEYACRGGTTTGLNSGSYPNDRSDLVDPALNAVGRYIRNAGQNGNPEYGEPN